MSHPLDRPIWTALTTRQAALAQVAGGVRRFHPAYGGFAASAEGSTASLTALAALVPVDGLVFLQHSDAIAPPPGFVSVDAFRTLQMVADSLTPAAGRAVEELTPADGPEMLALATLTRPGPFAEKTHEVGRFVGIRQNGRLIAMAGERMKPGTFTEVSGVCTHPDHRGHGHAAHLTRDIASGILRRGEIPFLHVVADNHSAISVYQRIGFVTRWDPMLLIWRRTATA